MVRESSAVLRQPWALHLDCRERPDCTRPLAGNSSQIRSTGTYASTLTIHNVQSAQNEIDDRQVEE